MFSGLYDHAVLLVTLKMETFNLKWYLPTRLHGYNPEDHSVN